MDVRARASFGSRRVKAPGGRRTALLTHRQNAAGRSNNEYYSRCGQRNAICGHATNDWWRGSQKSKCNELWCKYGLS